MKRSLIIAGLLAISVVNARADHMVFTWHDTIRPHGHKRPDAIGDANVNACNEKFGVPYRAISRAYRTCMNELGYRFVSAHMVRSREPMQSAPDDDSYSPPADIDMPSSSPPPPDITPPPPPYEPPPPVDIHPFCADTIC